jgi:bifunctional ADP-heptose synthase (sugar kinase/adenylyltransferase)
VDSEDSLLGGNQIAAAAAELGRVVEGQVVLVTRSEQGMTLSIDGAAPHVPA